MEETLKSPSSSWASDCSLAARRPLVGLTHCFLSSPLQVTNVDDEGVELGSGVMELTQSELVLHLRRREAVRWPYLCLRRYGYDSNLFSFESGRRCQTGQGECWPCLTHPPPSGSGAGRGPPTR